ncbi:MAG: hypothetical protein IJQ28_06935 [Clostridia bacterium]|nr:hypothetical protein [Clostridia bacterium]
MKAWKDADAYKVNFYGRVRRYYKYDTSNPSYHIIPNGNLTNTDGVLSGFTSSIYAKIEPPFMVSTNTWEIVFKFTTGTNISSEQYVFASQRGSSGAYHGIFFEIKSSKIFMQGSTNGSSWNINTGSTTTLTASTTYWAKGVFDGSTYKFYLSTDGTSFTQEGSTVTNSNPIYQTTVVSRIGVYGNAAGYPFNGTVDLKESYINIGGGKWWEGVTYPILPATSSDYDFYKDERVYQAFNI